MSSGEGVKMLCGRVGGIVTEERKDITCKKCRDLANRAILAKPAEPKPVTKVTVEEAMALQQAAGRKANG